MAHAVSALLCDIGAASLFSEPINLHGVVMARMKCNAALLQYCNGYYELVPIGRDNATYVRGQNVYAATHGDIARLQHDIVSLYSAAREPNM